jgi:MscS family membrane protein
MILAGVVVMAIMFAPASSVFGESPAAPSSSDSSSVAGVTAKVAVPKLLKPADTSSPGATLQSFLENMSRSYLILAKGQRKGKISLDTGSSNTKIQNLKDAERYFTRAVSCLDLSEVPAGLKKELSYESALKLKEILDRIDIPSPDLIPEADALEKEALEMGFSTNPRWRIPATNIVIERVADGTREGEYLFSPGTVSRLEKFFSTVEHLPYKESEFVTEGFLEYYMSTPGWLIPPKWSKWLPSWTKHDFLSMTIWRWMALGTMVLLWYWVIKISINILLAQATMNSPAARSWKRAIFCLTAMATLLVVHIIIREQIVIAGPVFIFLRIILSPVWWLIAAAMTFFVLHAMGESIIASPKVDPEGIQAAFFRALFGLLGFVAGGTVFIVGLSRVGVSLVPLLTGLGIGGLALAMAARPTLEGIISSFTIFADNPYRVGERVNVLGHNGTVDSIGLRSTRVRLLNEHVTAIPNEVMAAAEVENIGRRTCIRRLFDVTITYDTPPDKINRAVEILGEILAVPAEREGEAEPHPNEAINRPDHPPRVYFNELNSDSLNIYVSYWYHPPDYWAYMEHAHQVNLQIMHRFNAEGIKFAFPTQTVHLAGTQEDAT